MKRFGQILRVRAEHLESYKELHRAVWPEVLAMISDCHINNYSIFYRDNLLFAYFAVVAISLIVPASMVSALPQQSALVAADDLNKVVPASFYFEGQVGPTQMRNAAAVRFGASRHFVAALVDTSGYASSVRSKYEGFLITDEAVNLGGTELKAGAYGFGVSEDQKMNIFDIGGKQILALQAKKDEKLSSPRPLNIVQEGKSYRLYKGRTYVTLTMK